MYNPNFYAPLAAPMYYAGGGNVASQQKYGLAAAAEQLRQRGRGGDTILAHINPEEAGILKALGGSGTVNPHTGLPEFGWNPIKAVSKLVSNVVGAAEDVVKPVVKAIVNNPLESAALAAAAIVAPQLLLGGASFAPEAAAALGAGEAAAAGAGLAGLGAEVFPIASGMTAAEAAAATTPIAGTAAGGAGIASTLAPAATVAGGGAAELASVGATGAGLTTPAATVPSAFNAAVNTAVSGAPAAGGFGAVGTGGFGAAAPSAADIAAGLGGAGMSAGTAANLAGQTAAGTGAAGATGAGIGSLIGDVAGTVKKFIPTNLKEVKDAAQLASMGTFGYGTLTAAQEAKKQREAAERELARQEAQRQDSIRKAESIMQSSPSRFRRLTAEDVRKYGIGMPRDLMPPITRAAGGGQIYESFDDASGYDYAAGGALPPRYLSGGGDGMSDSIPARIGGKQEARLADGEFVIPADVVSHLGNGSSNAGAKKLYAMMDRIRKARTGKTKQAPAVKTSRMMPV